MARTAPYGVSTQTGFSVVLHRKLAAGKSVLQIFVSLYGYRSIRDQLRFWHSDRICAMNIESNVSNVMALAPHSIR